MTNTDHDTKFSRAAELLFDDLPWDDINIDMEKRGWEARWKICIAQWVYDIVRHALYCNGIAISYWPGEELYGKASSLY